MVGRRRHHAVGAVLLDHLEEAVQHPPNLAHVVDDRAFRADRVELVEEVHPPGPAGGVEDLPQLGRGLAHESRDEAVEPDLKQRKTEFARQDRSGERLPGARRADEQELPPRGKAVVENPPGVALLANDAPDPIRERLPEDHAHRRRRRIFKSPPVSEVSPGPAVPGRSAAARRSLSFSEYSDYYEHQRAGTRTGGSVGDAAPTVLEWETGSCHLPRPRSLTPEHWSPVADPCSISWPRRRVTKRPR